MYLKICWAPKTCSPGDFGLINVRKEALLQFHLFLNPAVLNISSSSPHSSSNILLVRWTFSTFYLDGSLTWFVSSSEPLSRSDYEATVPLTLLSSLIYRWLLYAIVGEVITEGHPSIIHPASIFIKMCLHVCVRETLGVQRLLLRFFHVFLLFIVLIFFLEKPLSHQQSKNVEVKMHTGLCRCHSWPFDFPLHCYKERNSQIG